jgi:O-antigen/teichoic acid export membrane protein
MIEQVDVMAGLEPPDRPRGSPSGLDEGHGLRAAQKWRELWRPVLASASAGTANRAVAIGIRLFTVPLLLRYLGTERYGLWMTIASASAYMSLLDLGTVSALTNRLTRCFARQRNDVAAAYLRAASRALAIAAAAALCISVIAIAIVDWPTLFALTSPQAVREVRATLTIAVILASLQLAFAAMLRVPYTMQQGALSERYQLGGNLLSLAGIIVAVATGASLPVLAAALMVGPVAASLAVALHLRASGLLPRSAVSSRRIWRLVRVLARAGGPFVVMQVVSTLLFAAQFPILAFYHGAAAVAPYALLTQLMMGLQTPLTVAQQPLWTRIAALRDTGDAAGIARVVKQYLAVALAFSTIAGVALIIFASPLISFLSSTHVSLPLDLRLAFAILCGLGLVGGGNLGAVLLAMELNRPLARINVLQLLVFFMAAAALVPTHGATGMAWSVCIIYLVSLPPTLVLLKRRLSIVGRGLWTPPVVGSTA